MQAFDTLRGVAMPLDRSNIDTDTIIPQRWLVTVRRTGLGQGLFGSWRYDENDQERPEFVLNQPHYRNTRIIVAGPNYGCGSSREHAVWAHLDHGVRAVIAPSFGPIFYENSLNNGLLPVEIPGAELASLMQKLLAAPGAECSVDLSAETVTAPDGYVHHFRLDPARREAMLLGMDDIAQTESLLEQIEAFQARQAAAMPWLR